MNNIAKQLKTMVTAINSNKNTRNEIRKHPGNQHTVGVDFHV
jgi:hypothetical protein